MSCYCGRTETFEKCCGKFIKGLETPKNAEELMRSRYAAYCTVSMDYIVATTDLQVRFDFDHKANEEWARNSKFHKLEILKAEEAGTKSIVEFKAYFNLDSSEHIHHEISTFRKTNGTWFFRAARVIPSK